MTSRHKPIEERLMEKVQQDALTGCWNWTGLLRGSKGYSTIRIGAKMWLGHRAMYEIKRGSIPPGTEIDHLCRNPKCVNPAHLEAVPHRVNVLRGEAVKPHIPKTHCIRGHELTPDNTVIKRNKRRQFRRCKACLMAERERESLARKGLQEGGEEIMSNTKPINELKFKDGTTYGIRRELEKQIASLRSELAATSRKLVEAESELERARQWRTQLLDCWAKDHQATMTALLEAGWE